MSRLSIAAVAGVALVTAAAAFAQTSGGTGPAPAPKQSEQYDSATRVRSLCIEHFARSAGRLAYLEAKLELNAEQQPLWDKWRQAVAAGAEKERADCLASVPTAGTRPSVLDRDSRFEKMLAIKVATLQTARPALEALYQSLSPEQRLVFDLPLHGRHEEGHRHPHRMIGHEQL